MALDTVYVITIFIAVWGAFLSTILAIIKIRENRPKLKVELAPRLIRGDGSILGDTDTRNVLSVSCANIGKRPITVNSCGIKLPKNKIMYILTNSPDQLPKKLEDGESCTIIDEISRVARKLISEGFEDKMKLKGFFYRCNWKAISQQKNNF
ncbi:MAG: hypothetical protein PHS47_03650 [Methanocellales archaeon]|nr:hypothetical protein [Methanocellales archaeon]MDD4898437.1 hypothetical protein [Methanocellales archaeon]MDD5446277.1 hypothetical protein [Methanocellales archaeon]